MLERGENQNKPTLYCLQSLKRLARKVYPKSPRNICTTVSARTDSPPQTAQNSILLDFSNWLIWNRREESNVNHYMNHKSMLGESIYAYIYMYIYLSRWCSLTSAFEYIRKEGEQPITFFIVLWTYLNLAKWGWKIKDNKQKKKTNAYFVNFFAVGTFLWKRY